MGEWERGGTGAQPEVSSTRMALTQPDPIPPVRTIAFLSGGCHLAGQWMPLPDKVSQG